MEECKACGKCCEKHWLVKLTNDREKERFPQSKYDKGFMWTDQCPYLKAGKCTTHDDKPLKCREYFCEGKDLEIVAF